MNQKIQIKHLNEIQKEEWLKLWKGYQTFYQAQISDEVSNHTWNRLTQNSSAHIYGFAAVLDNQIVGIVHVIEHESCWTIKPYAYLQDLFTDEAFRGQGIAQRLIEHVSEYTQMRQCDRVYWLTHDSNKIAQSLYDKVAKKTGFIQYRL